VNGTQRRVAELRWLLSEGRALRAVRNRTQARQTMTHARHHGRLSSDCASAANVLKSRMVGVHMQVRGVQPAHSSGCCARYMTDRDPKCMRLVCLHVNLTRPLLLRKWSHDTMTTLEALLAKPDGPRAAGGTNDVLARQLGLRDAAPLELSTQAQEHKLVVFVPAENVEAVLAAVRVVSHQISCFFLFDSLFDVQGQVSCRCRSSGQPARQESSFIEMKCSSVHMPS